jgi:hypothetical protein
MDAIITLFVELTNEIFWDGYAEQLSAENPAKFKAELTDFSQTYTF